MTVRNALWIACLLVGCPTPEVGEPKDSGQDCQPVDEIPYDGLDQDCDGTDLADVDGDGWDASEAGGDDCDDANAEVNPDADEICNGTDDDCDDLVDGQDGDLQGPSTWYADADSDGYGDADSTVPACHQPSGHVAEGTDCDDSDNAVHPGAAEICNGIDDDCDGLVDGQDDDVQGASTWYEDADGDGYGDASGGMPACHQPSGHVADGSDCDDDDGEISPEAGEICNGIDDDCDGLVDDDDPSVTGRTMWYADDDGDGYGDASDYAPACDQPSGYVSDRSDCDDDDPSSTVGCGGSADDGTICSALMGSDDGLVPVWTGDCDSGAGYEYYAGHCYYAVSTDTAWTDARASCIAAGGYLATVADASENTVIQAQNDRPYLGGCDGDTEGVWTWVTGEAFDYTSWEGTEPNDMSGEDCLEMYASGAGDWNDIDCSSDPWTQGYVCEFEGVISGADTGL